MNNTINIYCDESCHLENDSYSSMVLGCIWTQEAEKTTIFKRIREIKVEHGLKPNCEIKWTKVSPSKQAFYVDLINYFFDNKDLHFRGVIIPDKSKLQHNQFHQSHNDWYYKMYFEMLKTIISPTDSHKIYIDIKDTVGGQKIANLHKVLNNNFYDFDATIIERIQLVRSHEVEILQLADLIIGALSHHHRKIKTSVAKQTIIDKIIEKSGYELNKTTLLRENKMNLLVWEPSQKSWL